MSLAGVSGCDFQVSGSGDETTLGCGLRAGRRLRTASSLVTVSTCDSRDLESKNEIWLRFARNCLPRAGESRWNLSL